MLGHLEVGHGLGSVARHLLALAHGSTTLRSVLAQVLYRALWVGRGADGQELPALAIALADVVVDPLAEVDLRRLTFHPRFIEGDGDGEALVVRLAVEITSRLQEGVDGLGKGLELAQDLGLARLGSGQGSILLSLRDGAHEV